MESLRGVLASRAGSYVLTVLCAGCVVLAMSAAELSTTYLPPQWWALVALTLVSGSASLKIPAIPANFSISDVFTLTSAVVFGPAAGTVMVAIDSLVISACLVRKVLPLERILFNAAAPPVAMWLSAHAFFWASGIQPLVLHPLGLEVVGPWLLVFAAVYFFLNTFAIAVAIALHERVNALVIWWAHFQNLWFTFIGGAVGAAFVVFALQLGIYGIVVLAFPLLLAAILHFAYQNATGRTADQLKHLAEVNRLNLSTIEALAHAIDAKDGVTHRHIRRVQRSAVALAGRVGIEDQLQIQAIEAAALLHDIGKLAIPEHILNKPGQLTPVEFERMKSHARIGAEILSEVNFPYPVVPIVRHHHENWDGSGYPDGLKGADIPIGARILAVVDCFDALTSHRPYRRALSAADAFEIIVKRRGTMYDPAIVDAFREMCMDAPIESTSPIEPTKAAAADFQAPRASRDPVVASADEVRMGMLLGAALASLSGGRCPYQRLAEALCQLPDVDTVAIFMADRGQDRLLSHRVSGRHAPSLQGVAIPIGERMSGWAAASGEPMINGDAALDLFDTMADSLQSGIAVPYNAPDGGWVISLYSTRRGAFSAEHVRLVRAAISQIDGQHPTAAKSRSERSTLSLVKSGHPR
jgi:putative nucleotidyltransferase with HDIG domain